MSALDAVSEALIAGVCAELKLDHDRARFVVEQALGAKIPIGEPMYGLEGKGLFARNVSDNSAEVLAKHFDWLCVPMISSESRAKINRNRAFYTKARELGLVITGFDWLPPIAGFINGLQDAIAFCADVGGRAFVLDAEAAFKGHPDEAAQYVNAARRFCDQYGIKLGFTSFGGAYGFPTMPWSVFCKGTDFSIPQTYDNDHALDPNYMPRSIAAYRQYGASRIILGLGLYRETSPGSGSYRWRQPVELKAHLQLVPPGINSVVFWPLAGAIPAPALAELDRWHVPSDTTVRDVLTNLTPFGRLTRD